MGIVVLDEADKLARRSSSSSDASRDVSGEGVQQGLLRMLEGSVVSSSSHSFFSLRDDRLLVPPIF